MAESPDVIVAGAGIIGAAVAHELTRRGARVRMLDMRGVGQGATQASAGVLAPYIEGRGPLLELTARSLALYDEFIARVQSDAGTAVEYRRNGTIQVAADEESLAKLEQARDLLAIIGVASELLDAQAAREAEPQLVEDVAGALLVPDHGLVAAGALTQLLAHAAELRGAEFVRTTGVNRVEPTHDGRVLVEVNEGQLDADVVVLATGCWSCQVEVAGAEPLPVRPVRGQILTLGWPSPPINRVTWSDRCYLVPWSDGSVLVGATIEEAGYDERATVAGVRDLLEAVSEVIPRAWHAGFQGVRVGLRPATPDELPIIGPSGVVPGLVYATGHYRNGVLLAPLTATLVADLIVEGRQDEALEATRPGRFGTH